MTKDGVRLHLFHFLLKIKLKNDVQSRIKSFRQLPGEQFHEAFNRLKNLLRTCPHHDVPKWELVKVFYDGLDSNNQQFVVAISGGVFFSRPMEEEWDIFEKLSKGSRTQALVDRTNNHSSSINSVSNPNGFRKEMKSKIGELNKKFDLLLRNIRKGSSNVSHIQRYKELVRCAEILVTWLIGFNYGDHHHHPRHRWRNEDDTRPNNGQQYNSGYEPRYEGGGSSNYQQQQHSYQQRPQQL
ncbi:DNA-directed DNA polymerase [Tanacetum coccineum]